MKVRCPLQGIIPLGFPSVIVPLLYIALDYTIDIILSGEKLSLPGINPNATSSFYIIEKHDSTEDDPVYGKGVEIMFCNKSKECLYNKKC